jgi:RimJ/RimL family protein N-acetyltransferase
MNPVLDRNGQHDLPPGKIAALTTHLEMRAPPAPRPVPPRPDLHLDRIERVDLARYRELFRRVGQEWLGFSRILVPDERLAEIVHDPRIELWVLSRSGQDIGLLELDRREPGDVELSFFGLVADAVGGGAGRLMMDRAIERAFAEPGVRRFWLHTCTFDHPAALAFYIRSGFTPYARSVEVADDPRVLGLVPREVAPWLPIIG